MKIHKLVLTGGPCGGKTSAMAYLKRRLEELGYFVIVVPEAATICIKGGINPAHSFITPAILQTAVVGTSRSLEDRFIAAATEILEKNSSACKGIVVLYDRGIADGLAYVDQELFESVLKGEDLELGGVKSKQRYDAIFHLRTAAIGAEEFYTLANNAARSETPEQARELDARTEAAWTGHDHLRIIGNDTDFDGKLNRVFQEVCVVLGIPVPIESERKFLVRFSHEDIPETAQRVDIEQVYLITPDEESERRVRRRIQHGFPVHYKTEKGKFGKERFEIERIIEQSEFGFALAFQKPGTKPVVKTRTCFVHKDQYFELDQFQDPNALPEESDGRQLLEIELTSDDQQVSLPDWMIDCEEVTGNPDYSNARIAERLAVAA